MKLKSTIFALCACTIAILPAQTAAPEKAKAENAEEPKAETPVEKKAFEIFDVVFGSLPTILGNVKDDATLLVAEKELDAMFKKLKEKEAELLKLPVPDNEARKKLSAKMNLKEKAMNKKMQAVMMGMQQLPPETAQKLGPMMMNFGKKMDAMEPNMSKYFEPDEEKETEGKDK